VSASPARRRALRGPALTFVDDPFRAGPEHALRYESDALLIVENGRIAAFGDYASIRHSLRETDPLDRFGADCLILPGFVDTHVHYPQTQIIGAYGKQLIDWLNDYTFVTEQQFADPVHCRQVAELYLQQCLRNGITTSAVYCTVHPQSVDAFFEAADALGMRMVAGKVLMDRNAPAALTDTARSGYDDSKALIARWHGRGRGLYAITPRFAPTSSPEQLEAAAALWKEHPGTYMQTHVSENRGEIDWVAALFPDRSGYLDVYAHYGLLGPRAVLGHGIWLSDAEFAQCHDTGTAIAHCPTSNLFLGSGLFRLHDARGGPRPVQVGLATDLGGGTSFSPLATMKAAYQIAQLNGRSLSAPEAFWLATRGAAQALQLEDRIGSLAAGQEADLLVLDLRSTPLIDFRMKYCRGIDDALFVQMILGDDRATRATYIAGEPAYIQDRTGSAAPA